MTRGNSDAPLTLGAIYALADPFVSREQFDRYHHRDVGRLTLAELEVERARCRLRILLDPDPDPWLFERFRQLDGPRHAPR